VAALVQTLPQRRAEHSGDAVLEAIRAAHGDAETGADRAPRAIGADHEPRTDRPGLPRADVAQLHSVAADTDNLGSGPHLSGGQQTQVLGQDRLEQVLRDACGSLRAQDLALLARRVADGEGLA
jgi:hypothetical protein